MNQSECILLKNALQYTYLNDRIDVLLNIYCPIWVYMSIKHTNESLRCLLGRTAERSDNDGSG